MQLILVLLYFKTKTLFIMSIENIDQLITFLTNFRNKVDKNSTINPIESEILKKELLHFYQINYLNFSIESDSIKEIIAPISNAPIIEKEIKIESDVDVIQKSVINDLTSAPITENTTTKTDEILVNEIEIPKPVVSTPEINIQNDMSKIEVQQENINVVERNINFSEPIVNQFTDLKEKLNNSKSLNDKFQSNASIVDRMSSKNKSINDMIDLNKRLLFVDVLFKGNSPLFNQVIQHIDEYKTADEAIKFLDFNKEKLDLNEKKESVYNSLIDLINKKFS